MTRIMYDAAYPPPDPHLDVCAFYIGVLNNTPHVWSDAEIKAQSARWRLPIMTRVNAQGVTQANTDADAAASWMEGRRVPLGSAFAIDFEAQVNGTYVSAFDKRLLAQGYKTLLYGQASTVYQNPEPSAGYWSGQWTGVPHLDARDSATQWASDTMLGKPYDLSQVSDSLVLWDTKGVPVVEQTDKVIGNLSRGNTIGDVLADLSNLRDEFYLPPGTDSKNPWPANSRIAGLFNDIAAIKAAVTSPPQINVQALAAALAPLINAGATPDEVAAAVVQHLSADLAKG